MKGAGDKRQQVLSLYRNILRTGRTWQGSAEEKEYIRTEAREQFRLHASARDAAEVAALVQEAETRLEYAKHYGIPYPRLQHAQQFSRRYFMDAPSADAAAGARVPSSRDSDVAAKLAAAADRRKAKLQHERQDAGKPV